MFDPQKRQIVSFLLFGRKTAATLLDFFYFRSIQVLNKNSSAISFRLVRKSRKSILHVNIYKCTLCRRCGTVLDFYFQIVFAKSVSKCLTLIVLLRSTEGISRCYVLISQYRPIRCRCNYQ